MRQNPQEISHSFPKLEPVDIWEPELKPVPLPVEPKASVQKETMEELEKRLMVDYHLTPDEIRVIRDAYLERRKELFRATRKELQDFINKDYRSANEEALGGTKGIEALQTALKIKVDGKFGPTTFRTLIDYQKKNGLRTDGVAGPRTIAKLGIAEAISGKATIAPEMPVVKVTPPAAPVAPAAPTVQPTEPKAAETPAVTPTLPAVTKALQKHATLSRMVRENLDSIRVSRDENTGFFNVLADDLVGLANGETGRDIYMRSWKLAQEQAATYQRDLLSSLSRIDLQPKERKQLEKLNQAYLEMSQETLDGMGVLKSVGNTILDIPEDLALAGNGAVGIGKGVVDGFIHVVDLTVFLGKFAFSSEYRKTIGQQWDMIMEARKKAGGITPLIAQAFQTEVARIASLPSHEQSQAIGKIFGVVLGTGGTVIGATKLGKKGVGMVAASRAAKSAQKAAEAAAESSKAAAALATQQAATAPTAAAAATATEEAALHTAEAARQTATAVKLGTEAAVSKAQAIALKTGGTILAGPAETAITKYTSALFSKAYLLIRANKAPTLTIEEAIAKAIVDNAEQMKIAVESKDQFRIGELEKQLRFLQAAQAKIRSEAPRPAKSAAPKEATKAKLKPGSELPKPEPKTAPENTKPPEVPTEKPEAAPKTPETPPQKPEPEYIPSFLRKPEPEAAPVIHPTTYTFNPSMGVKENIRKFNRVYGPNGQVREGASPKDIQRFDSYYTALNQVHDVLKKAVLSGDQEIINQATNDVKRFLVDPDAGVKYVTSDEFKTKALSRLRESENGTSGASTETRTPDGQGNSFLKGLFSKTYSNLDRQFSLTRHVEGSVQYMENLVCRELLESLKFWAESGRFSWNDAVSHIYSFEKNPRDFVKEMLGMNFEEAVRRRTGAWNTQRTAGGR